MDAYAKSKTPKEARDKRATPPGVFKIFERVFGLSFNFDVCAEAKTAKVAKFWTEKDDALSREWTKEIRKLLGGRMPVIFMNPPYSDPGTWCKMAAEQAKQGAIIVGLLPDDRSTGWYQDYIDGVAATVFIPDRRISFHDASGVPQPGNPKGSVFAMWVPWKVDHTNEVRFILEDKKK